MSVRRQEVSSLPRRGPFEDIEFFDNFAGYPDGALVGRGLWVAAPGGEASPLVAGHRVLGVAGEDRQASINLGALNVDLTRPWAFGFTLQFDGPPAGPFQESYAYIIVGDELGAQNAIVVSMNFTSGGANHAAISLVDDLSNQYLVNVPFTFGVSHLVTITWDGVIHRAFVDGVQVVSGLLRNPSTLTLKYANMDVADLVPPAFWTVYNFQFTGKIPA